MQMVVMSMEGVINFMKSSFKETRKNIADNFEYLLTQDKRDKSEIMDYLGLFSNERIDRLLKDDHNNTLKQICNIADVMGVKPSELLEDGLNE